MINIDIIYIFLYLSVFLVFYKCGENISKGGNYYLYATICLLAFTFTIGSRYDRGPDYFGYIYGYLYDEEKFGNQGMPYFNNLLKTWGVDRYHVFYYYAFATMTGAMIFLKRYNKYATYIFPTFYLAILKLAENIVRQMLGFSFVLIFFLQLFQINIDKKNNFLSYRNTYHLGLAIVAVFIAINIHSACFIDISVMSFLYLFIKKPIPLKISISLVLASSYIIPKIYDVNAISPILNILGYQNEMFYRYVENGDWFSSDAASTEVAENPIIKCFEVLGNIALLYFGRKVIMTKANNRDSIAIYNCFFIGTCIVMSFKLIEIPARVGALLRLYWFYPLALVLYYRKEIIKTKKERWLSICLTFWVYAFAKHLFINEGKTLFIWDVGKF